MSLGPFKILSKKVLFFILKSLGKRYIVILGHTRSGSTLLTQLLSNSDEVAGYGELFIPFFEEGKWALVNIPLTLGRKKTPGLIKARYYLDKLLFDDLIRSEKILEENSAYFIFILRHPSYSLPSIYKKSYDLDQKYTQQDALDYYISRMNRLVGYYQKTDKSKRILIHYESLVNNTSDVLDNLSAFLQLRKKLSPQYKPYEKNSGYIGDFSSHIFEGKVLNNIVSTAKDVKLDKELFDKAVEHYHKCLEKMN